MNTEKLVDPLGTIWGTWSLQRGTGERVILDLFVNDGSPRDPWLLTIPLDHLDADQWKRLAFLVENLPSPEDQTVPKQPVEVTHRLLQGLRVRSWPRQGGSDEDR